MHHKCHKRSCLLHHQLIPITVSIATTPPIQVRNCNSIINPWIPCTQHALSSEVHDNEKLIHMDNPLTYRHFSGHQIGRKHQNATYAIRGTDGELRKCRNCVTLTDGSKSCVCKGQENENTNYPLGGWFGWGSWPWGTYGDFCGETGRAEHQEVHGGHGYYSEVGEQTYGHGNGYSHHEGAQGTGCRNIINRNNKQYINMAHLKTIEQGVRYPNHFGDWWRSRGQHGWEHSGDPDGHVNHGTHQGKRYDQKIRAKAKTIEQGVKYPNHFGDWWRSRGQHGWEHSGDPDGHANHGSHQGKRYKSTKQEVKHANRFRSWGRSHGLHNLKNSVNPNRSHVKKRVQKKIEKKKTKVVDTAALETKPIEKTTKTYNVIHERVPSSQPPSQTKTFVPVDNAYSVNLSSPAMATANLSEPQNTTSVVGAAAPHFIQPSKTLSSRVANWTPGTPNNTNAIASVKPMAANNATRIKMIPNESMNFKKPTIQVDSGYTRGIYYSMGYVNGGIGGVSAISMYGAPNTQKGVHAVEKSSIEKKKISVDKFR